MGKKQRALILNAHTITTIPGLATTLMFIDTVFHVVIAMDTELDKISEPGECKIASNG